MAKFGFILSDSKVFQGDLIQFDFSKSTFNGADIPQTVSHEFSINGTDFVNVTDKKQISWVFNDSGPQPIYLTLNSSLGSELFTTSIEVLDIVDAKLFTTDFDLVAYEPDIMKYLPKKWSSWNIIHMRAQDYIINYLSEKAILDKFGNAYTKDDIRDIKEVKDWSSALVLRYIFNTISNADNDIFKSKSDEYEEIANARGSRARINLDHNKNSKTDDEVQDLRSVEVNRA